MTLASNLSGPLCASETVVEINKLSRRFGDKQALDSIAMNVPAGGVFGLVGVNGAGKTTLIKHILGLLVAEQGTVDVFGLNPIAHPEQVLAHVGYMSEVTELPDWMRGSELIRYTQAFYPTWDKAYCAQLVKLFEIDLNKKVRDLSKGQRARVALLLALAHRPRLLILDEPSSGLDPLVRRDILRTVIQTVANQGHTVVFSSHLLEEVERIADYVAIIDSGQIIAQSALDELKLQHLRLSLNFSDPVQSPPTVPNCFGWAGSHTHWTTVFRGSSDQANQLAEDHQATIVNQTTPNLDEIFFALAAAKHQYNATGLLQA